MNLDNKILKENPYKVPDNYFEEFNKKLMDKIEMDKPETKVKKRRFILFRPAVAAAASILVIFALSLVFINRMDTSSNLLAEQNEPANAYSLEDYLLNVDESAIFEAIETNIENNNDEILDLTTIEEVLIASVSDYELMMN